MTQMSQPSRFTVEARGPIHDPLADPGGFVPLYETMRPFPADLEAHLTVEIEYVDVHDLHARRAGRRPPHPDWANGAGSVCRGRT